MMFWYYTSSQLHAIFPEVRDACWRCGHGGATLFHIFLGLPYHPQLLEDGAGGVGHEQFSHTALIPPECPTLQAWS